MPRLPEDIEKFMKALAYRMYALRDNKDKEDITERVTTEMFSENLEADHGTMFTSLTVYPEWSKNTVIGVDLNLVWDGKEIPMRFITQNPAKLSQQNPNVLSKYAILDRAGHVVVWVMRRMSTGDTVFLGHILDGEYISNKVETTTAEPVTEKVDTKPNSFRDLVMEITVTLPHVGHDNVNSVITEAARLGKLG